MHFLTPSAFATIMAGRRSLANQKGMSPCATLETAYDDFPATFRVAADKEAPMSTRRGILVGVVSSLFTLLLVFVLLPLSGAARAQSSNPLGPQQFQQDLLTPTPQALEPSDANARQFRGNRPHIPQRRGESLQ